MLFYVLDAFGFGCVWYVFLGVFGCFWMFFWDVFWMFWDVLSRDGNWNFAICVHLYAGRLP